MLVIRGLPNTRGLGGGREQSPNGLVLLPVSRLADLLPPDFAARYLRLDIFFPPLGWQRTGLFLGYVLESVQCVIARIAVGVGEMSRETRHCAWIFQVPAQGDQNARPRQVTRSTVEDRD